MIEKKTAVFIMGHHLQADDWRGVVWGDPATPGKQGRIARGLIEALRWDADLIMMGTGGSEKNGAVEADLMYEAAQGGIESLPEFSSVPDPKAWFVQRAVKEKSSKNTREEIIADANIALERGIERIVLVSSPSHILRAYKTAMSVFSKDERLSPFLHDLYAVASDVPYAGSTIDDVEIVEPPHRGDTPKVYFNETVNIIKHFLADMRFEELANKLKEDWDSAARARRGELEELKKRLGLL